MWDGQLTGEVLDGRYALGALYGAGGTAEVYRAFDSRLERDVAVKVFRGAAVLEDRLRLDREARVLATLHHPGMVAVHDTGSVGECPYFVMQAVDGGTLRRRMREPLAPVLVANLGAQVAAVLAHVHRHGVLHRDVKPSNIMLDREERRAYLTDFGLALQAHVTRLTRTGTVLGTAAYLAPEQVRGVALSPAVDVYALGLVLLECLTGRPEYPGGDAESALARLHRAPRVPDDLPAPLRDLVTAMTAMEPRDRPSAAHCADALTGMDLTTAVELPARTPPPRWPPTRRARAGPVSGAVAATALVVAALLGTEDDHPPVSEPPPPAGTRSTTGAVTTEVPVTTEPVTPEPPVPTTHEPPPVPVQAPATRQPVADPRPPVVERSGGDDEDDDGGEDGEGDEGDG